MTNISSFSWFDLSKYDAVEDLDLNGWYFQLEARQVIYTCSKYLKNMEFISMPTMELLNTKAKNNIALIKEKPLLIKEKSPLEFSSVKDADYLNLYWANYYRNNDLKNILKLSINEVTKDMLSKLVVPRPDKESAYDSAMLMISLGATDEQLKKDFDKWLKNYRSHSKCTVRKKQFTEPKTKKWTNNKVLPYLDLTLIADFENKQLTQNQLGRLLFPDDYDVDLTERIRRTVKPLADFLLDEATFESLNIQVGAT